MIALALGGAVGAVAVPRALVEVAPPHAISVAAPSPHRPTRVHVPAFSQPTPLNVLRAPEPKPNPNPAERRAGPSAPVSALASVVAGPQAREATPAQRPGPTRPVAKPKPPAKPAPAPTPAPAPVPEPAPTPVPIPEPVEARAAPTPEPAAAPARRGKGHDKPKHVSKVKREPLAPAPAQTSPLEPAPASEPAATTPPVEALAGEDETAKDHGNGKAKGHDKKND
jgi:DNA polymerase-3 subunit gamma/tau